MNGIIFVLCWQAVIKAKRTEEEVKKLSSYSRAAEKERSEWGFCYAPAAEEPMSVTEIIMLILWIITTVVVFGFIVGVEIIFFSDQHHPDDTDEMWQTKSELRQVSVWAEDYLDASSIEREASMMVDAMEAEKNYFTKDIYIGGIPEYSFQDVDQDDERYRDWAKQKLMLSAYNGDVARSLYDTEPTGELVGTTGAVLEWRDYPFLSHKLRARYWLIDQDGNGTWDWAARYRGTDEDSEFVFLSADGATPKFDGAEAIELPDDWSGTTADIEKMFKLSRSLDNLLCN